MTARSEHGRYVRGLVSAIDEDRPADTAALRAAINNTNHLLDQRGNTIAALAGTWKTHEDGDPSEWHQPFGFFDLIYPATVLASGDTARVVTHLRGNASTTGTVAFRVELMTLRGSRFPAEVGPTCAEVTTSSTSVVSLTPDPIYVPADELGDYAQEIPAPRTRWASSLIEHPTLAADGSVERIKTLFVRLRVWARRTSGSATPVLRALSAREYIAGG